MVARVITETLETAPRDATHWSTPSMAQATGMSQSAIARIWKPFALQPHRVETFKLSKDPLYLEKCAVQTFRSGRLARLRRFAVLVFGRIAANLLDEERASTR
jgi:hypothetical protein